MSMAESSALAVHRCRFVDFTPSAITCLAFPPLPLPSLKGKGRANGNIEVCVWTGDARQAQSYQAWVVRKTISGATGSKIDSMVLTLKDTDVMENPIPSTSELRLFTSGGDSELMEWDMHAGIVKRSISSQGGSIWSMAANPASTLLALGCEDGCVRIISLSHDTFSHYRKFDRIKSRPLSIAWGPAIPRRNAKEIHDGSDSEDGDDDEDQWADSWLVTGGSDSSLRKWDVATGRVMERMSTEKLRGERTLVWSVGTLGDGTIVSGDSMGLVKFWDSQTCTQLQSFPAHGADVLCITISADGQTVFTSGVDQKIAKFTFINKISGSTVLSNRWIQSCTRRLHAHDVRSIAIWPPYTPLPASHSRKTSHSIAPILVSGGLDMSVIFTPAASAPSTSLTKVINPLNTSTVSTFEDSYHRRLSYCSGPSSTSGVSISKAARLLCCMRETSIGIWRVLQKPSHSQEIDVADDLEKGGWEQVAELELKTRTNLVACSISDDGRWLAVSDTPETKLFTLLQKDKSLMLRRVRDFAALIGTHSGVESTGSSVLQFTPDSTKLIMGLVSSSLMLVVDLTHTSGLPQVLHVFRYHHYPIKFSTAPASPQPKQINGFQHTGMTPPPTDVEMTNGVTIKYDRPILASRIRCLAISADGQWLASTDDLGRTHISNLDTLKHHCSIPPFRHPAQVLSFNANGSLLLMGFPDNAVELFDAESRSFSSTWKGLPRLGETHDSLIGAFFLEEKTVLLWSATWICKTKLDVVTAASPRKRQRSNSHARIEFSANRKSENDAFNMITRYSSILHVGLIGSQELVIVERPLMDVMGILPPAYFKPKYGQT